jgi:hypothetical protein
MAYSTPLTAVSSTALTAAQWNASVRDDMLVTPAALATTTGRIFVSTGANAIAERAILSATVATAQSTSSATYTNLTTTGPVVTLTTGTNAIAFASARCSENTNAAFGAYGITVTGASNIPADDTQGMLFRFATAASSDLRPTLCVAFQSGGAGALTAGSNTFTMQYRASSSTATFQDRTLTVIAL